MDRYVANPVEADAAVIEDVRHTGELGMTTEVKFDGAWMKLPEGAGARYEPKAGDYYVRQEDGYVYVNPKHVFERKYRRLQEDSASPSRALASDPMTTQTSASATMVVPPSGLTEVKTLVPQPEQDSKT